MFENIENLKIVNIVSGFTKNRHNFVPCRKNHGFILRKSGHTRYSFEGFRIDLNPGEVIFLPKGAKYEFSVLTEDPCEYFIISFEGEITDATVASYSFDGFQEAEEFINDLPSLWSFGGKAEKYKCYAVFYNFLCYLEGLRNQTYIDKGKFNIISPAVSYMKAHIYDCELNIETLHKLCGISGTYFRYIFESHYGVSPLKYISSKRLSHAKAVIDSGDYNSICEIAEAVGYSDPLYFSRAFKKKYGISPKQYAKG